MALFSWDEELRRPVSTVYNDETGHVIINLNKAGYGYFDQPVVYQNRLFQPKDALHITIISQDAPVLLKHLESHPEDADDLQDLILSTNWSYRKRNEFYHVEKEPGIETIIQMVEVPSLQAFLRDASRLVGQGFLLPPTHVTLYMRGTETGIGLPNQESFQERVKAAIRPGEVRPAENAQGGKGSRQGIV